jgi:hypothetical protein
MTLGTSVRKWVPFWFAVPGVPYTTRQYNRALIEGPEIAVLGLIQKKATFNNALVAISSGGSPPQ